MAIRASIFNRNASPRGGAVTVSWAGLTFSTLDTGDYIDLAEYSDKTYQISGTLGVGGSLVIEGSNDGVNWTPLANRQGTAMSFTAPGMNTSQDRPIYVRPRVTAGDGTTSLTVVVACHRADLGVSGG